MVAISRGGDFGSLKRGVMDHIALFRYYDTNFIQVFGSWTIVCPHLTLVALEFAMLQVSVVNADNDQITSLVDML